MSNVTTFEQELEQRQVEKTPIQKVAERKAKPKKQVVKKSAIDKDKSAADKLMYDANSKLNYYLKKSPQFQIIEKQLAILRNEAKNYEKNGSFENLEKTQAIIDELVLRKKDLKTIFKTGDNSDATKKAELIQEVKKSPIIKELNQRKKELQIQLKNNTPSYLVGELKKFRYQLDMSDKFSGEEDVMEFDEFINDSKITDDLINATKLQQEYYDFCGKIADLINWDINEVIDGTLSHIKIALDSVLTESENIKNAIRKVEQQISNEKAAIYGSTKVTDLLFDIFDFKNDETEGKVPKEILAASNINLVKSIAYNVCIKNGALNHLDDAISAGLLGLTVAINSWYEAQKMADSALTFKGFANVYIHNAIQRDLLFLMDTSGGRLSGSTLATMHTLNKKKIADFLKYNPEFEDIDNSVLGEMLAAYDDSFKGIGKTVTESDYSNSVSGDEGDSSEVWMNAVTNEEDDYDLIESKIEYEKMLLSIKDLLNLFEHKKDKKSGLLEITNQKIFDKYDKQLFLMYFGLVHKLEKNNPDDKVMKPKVLASFDTGEEVKMNALPGEFSQEEMAMELFEMGLRNREGNPISQAAISDRIRVLLNKLKFAIDNNPKLKAGFEYFFNYWQQNKRALEKLSNSREEIGMKIDREELREIFGNDDDALNTQLSDGTKLGDVFDISDTNPLDDEIYGMFNE
jgi:hypothetical protein